MMLAIRGERMWRIARRPMNLHFNSMKTKSLLLACSVTVATALCSQAAITAFNQSNPPDASGLPSGGWGTYRGFSITFTDAALSQSADGLETGNVLSDYTTVFLDAMVLRHSGNQGPSPSAPTGDWTDARLKVYTSQTPTVSSYIGGSSNANDMSWGGSERNVTFNFGLLALDPTTKYYFYFSNTAGNVDPAEQTWTSGRLRVSNNSEHTYSSGNLINNSWGNQDTAFDAVLAASFSSIPEPTVALLGGLGLLQLLRRRRS